MEPYSLPQLPIEFEPVNHIYTVEGAKLPSVTQIMEPMSLILYRGIPWDVLAAAADRGTRVHEQVSNFIRFGLLEEDDDTAPYLMAYQAFSERYRPVWIASEYRVFHKLMRYSGTVDLLGFVEPDDGTGIDVVDIKATRQFHKVMLSTQVSAYAEAVKSHGVIVRERYGLQLCGDGKYRFERVADGYKTFLHCLAIQNEMAKENSA